MIRYITAAPKTGSSYIAGAVILMQTDRFNPEAHYRLYPPWWSRHTYWHDWDLVPELEPLLTGHFDTDLGNGGAVYKGHFWATQKNIGVLESGDGKLVIVLRSPLDTLTAQYCSVLDDPYSALYNPIYRIKHTEAFKDVDHGINELITGGYLFHLLTFYADWLMLRDDHWGIVIDYEGFIENPAEYMAIMARLTERPYDLGALQRNLKPLTEMYTKTEIPPEVYPRGWTGYHGVYENYFSAENKSEFKRVYEAVSKVHPGMELLREQYPGG